MVLRWGVESFAQLTELGADRPIDDPQPGPQPPRAARWQNIGRVLPATVIAAKCETNPEP